MDETVRNHLLQLEHLSVRLTSGLIHADNERRRGIVEGQLRAVDAALAHFRAALDILLLLDEQSTKAFAR